MDKKRADRAANEWLMAPRPKKKEQKKEDDSGGMANSEVTPPFLFLSPGIVEGRRGGRLMDN